MPDFKIAPGAEWSSPALIVDRLSDTASQGEAAIIMLASLAAVIVVARLCDGLTIGRRGRP